MTPKNGDKFAEDIKNRLSDFFAAPAADAPGNVPLEEPTDQLPGNPGAIRSSIPAADPSRGQFIELKAIVLSIEWEITDETMAALIAETDRLQQKYRDNPLFLSFLKLLGAVGKYVWKNKSQAHPASIRLMHSIYEKFETVYATMGMSDATRRNLLASEIKKFNKLKQLLQSDAREKRPAPAPERPVGPIAPGPVPKEKTPVASQTRAPVADAPDAKILLIQKIDRLERLIRDELEKLKIELRALK